MKEESADAIDRLAIKELFDVDLSFGNMHDRDDDGGETGPFEAAGGVGDGAAVGEDPLETRVAGVALGDGVGGDEADTAVDSEQREGAAEEVSGEVAVAVRAFM